MTPLTFEKKKELHEQEVRNNVERAKDSSNYCTYMREISEFDAEVTVYAARRIGRGHVKDGKPCQDYCMTQAVPKGQAFAVSDGVSACLRSDKGSRFACEAAIESVRQADAVAADERTFVAKLCALTFRKTLVNNWLKLVKKDVMETDGKEQASIRDIELYGATLSLAIMTENRIVTLNLGDGQILLFNPVDAMRVRWHLPKEDSVTAALCNPDCYEDSFIVHEHDRSVYSGILLSTDGIYDALSSYSSFYSYAQQITERFEANGEPLQPFCFLEKTAGGVRQIDLQANISKDDCSIILVADHHPLPASTGELFAAVSRDYRVTELQTRTDALSVYKLERDGELYFALAMKGDLAQRQQTQKEVASLELTTAQFLRPDCQWEENGATIAVYPESRFFTPGGFFAVGKLKEKAEVKYGLNASKLALQALHVLQRCDAELRQKGYCLNDNARFLAFLTDKGLVLLPEAVSPMEKAVEVKLLWQLFANQIGTLTCDTLTRPVFSCGFNGAGPNYLNPFRTPAENLCFLKRGADNQYQLVNTADAVWTMPDGKQVQRGDSVPLTDGLSFTIPGAEPGTTAMVTYKERTK